MHAMETPWTGGPAFDARLLAGAAPGAAIQVELRDWKVTHRPLSEERRTIVRDYIVAILRHDPLTRLADPEAQQHEADRLWRRFREHYDALNHSEREDFHLAVDRL